VNFDSFFLVANETTFFLKTVKVIGFNAVPELNMFDDFRTEDEYYKGVDYLYQ